MLRSVPPAVVLGALAVLSFGVGIALEPMFERPAHADLLARAAKSPKAAAAPANTEAAPAQSTAAGKAVDASMTPPDLSLEPAAAVADAPQSSSDADGGTVLENLPEEQGQGVLDAGRDVDMIDNSFDAGEASATAVPVPEAAPAATEAAAQN